MTNELAVKHKNSLMLKEAQTTPNKKSLKFFRLKSKTRSFQTIFFPAIICCVSFCYWLILCPLLWFTYYLSDTSKHWPTFWPILFWIIAVLLWSVIVILLMMVWKLMENRRSVNINRKSYGTDHAAVPMNLISKNTENEKKLSRTYLDDKKDTNIPKNIEHTNVPESSRNTADRSKTESKKKCELAPLIIHRKTSNNDREDVDEVITEKTQEKEKEEITEVDSNSNNAQRNSIKDYLTLVTVTPQEEEESSKLLLKSPMSPRDLFFIDMIREAEKAEQEKNNDGRNSKRFSRFFPDDLMIETKKTSNGDNKNEREKAKDLEENKDIDSKESERESNYFIANVGSPKNEKTEMFLEINSTVEDRSMEEKTVDLCSLKMGQDKPVLILRSASTNKENSKKALD